MVVSRVTEIHFLFLFAEKVSKFAEKQLVCLALAPLNLKPFLLILALRHSLWFGRYEMRCAAFPAQRCPDFVCSAQHAVTLFLGLAGIGEVVTMTTKEVFARRVNLNHTPSAGLPVHDTQTLKIGALTSVMALRID